VVKIAPYGTWASPISAAEVATGHRERRWVAAQPEHVWWTETRPDQGGRVTLMRSGPDGTREQMLAAPWSVRNRVHEYGGRPYVLNGHWVVFTNWADQRVYAFQPEGDPPMPISPEPEKHHGVRYSDLSNGPEGVWCVRETSIGDKPADVRRDLVELPVTGQAATDPGAVRVLAASHHFMTGPKLSPDGKRAAWLGWEHPNMPWDGN